MGTKISFTQACPTCGRQLSINVRLLGRKVACQHCHAEFAAAPAREHPEEDHSKSAILLRRAEELLRKTDSIVNS